MSMKEEQAEGKGRARLEQWEIERAREMLVAAGRLIDFDVFDIAEDELREIVGNVRHSQRMREPDFAELRERLS